MVDVKFTNEELENYIKLKLSKNVIENKDLLLVKELSFDNSKFKDLNLKGMSRFKNVEVLIFKNFELKKNVLREINKFKNLKILYFKNVTFNCRFKFKNNIKKVYFDKCVNFENIKFKNLSKFEILNSYVNNKLLKNIKKASDIRINKCKINEHINFKIISNVKVFYLNNVNLETNVFLEKFKNASTINLNGTNIVGKVDITNMRNMKNYYKIREVM